MNEQTLKAEQLIHYYGWVSVISTYFNGLADFMDKLENKIRDPSQVDERVRILKELREEYSEHKGNPFMLMVLWKNKICH